MPNIIDLELLPKKIIPVIFAVDISTRTSDRRMAMINEVMSIFFEKLRYVMTYNTDVEVKIGVLSFSSDTVWVTGEKLISLDEFCWKEVEEERISNFGMAINEIPSKLNRKALFESVGGIYPPIYSPFIIFVTDGYSDDDSQAALEKAKQNNAFEHAHKIAVCSSNDANKSFLEQVTGYSETVVIADRLNEFIKHVCFIPLDLMHPIEPSWI